MAADRLTGDTVELLQALIRNACVNDGSPGSGHEIRSATVLRDVLDARGCDVEMFEPAPGRASLVARIEGSDPGAPSLCLMGHTDVVPADASAWRHDPFGGELIDGEVWGRGAIDMLNLTSSMTVAFADLAASGFRPRGDLVLFAVADEESGSRFGAQWMADNAADAIRADYVLTESGGVHLGAEQDRVITVSVAERGVAWRRLRVRGTPGHGSAPYRSDNALVRAASVIQRISEYSAPVRLDDLWRERVGHLGLDAHTVEQLCDPDAVDAVLAALPDAGMAAGLHACCHLTMSPNASRGEFKTNTIPGVVDIEVDIRVLPGDTAADVDEHLRAALGDLADVVEVEVILDGPATISPVDTPLWHALQRAVARPFPLARLSPSMMIGFTDARVYRGIGSVAYGAGLFSPSLSPTEYASRFHGTDERIDVESLGLTTRLWGQVARDLCG